MYMSVLPILGPEGQYVGVAHCHLVGAGGMLPQKILDAQRCNLVHSGIHFLTSNA